MALDRAAKKRVALRVAGEIRSGFADRNGARLLAKHKARKAAPPPPADDEDMEGALGMSDDESAEMMDAAPMHGGKTKKGFPFKSAGGGMRGRGMKQE